MLFELILLLTFGLLFMILGLLIWKKEKIDLIHSYHYEKVTEENKGSYTAIMGKGLILIAAGMILTGVIDYLTQTTWGWIAFGIGFAVGVSFFIYAGRKYNR